MRIFVGIETESDVREYCACLQREIGGSGLVPAENLHITLVFVGEIASEDLNGVISAVESVCRNFSGFEYAVGDIGSFKRGKVNYLACRAEEFERLSRSIASQLELHGINYERRERFAGHITLRRGVKKELTAELPARKFTAKKAAVFESVSTPEGVRYLPVAKFLLV